MPDSLRVLIVEDNPADFRLMVHALRQGGFDPVCQRVDTEPAFSAMLDEHPDVILSDYNLPQFDALRALTLLRQRQWDIPFIIVSGSIGEDIAVGAMKQGAADFLLKDRMARLGPSVTLALEQKQLREGKRQADATLQKRARLDAMCADVGLALTRADTLRQMLQYCTESMVQHLGAAFARIWTLNEAESVLELQASAGLYTHIDGPHRRVPVGQFKIGLIALERKPHLTNDVCNDPRVGDRAWAQREGMISFAGYPLVLADRLVGVMAMFARHPLETVTLDAMSAVANQMALGIQRKQDEAHLAHLISSSPAVIFSLELKGEEVRLSWISDNIKKLFGYATQECLRPHWFEDCVHAEDMPTLSRRWPEVMRDGRHTSEFRFRHKNGNFRWVRDEIQLLSSKPGQPGECVGSWSDVTERKGAERRILAQHAVTRVLAESTSLFEAIKQILEVICHYLDWEVGEHWHVDSDANLLRFVQSRHQSSPIMAEFVTLSRQHAFAHGIGLPGRVWANGQADCVLNVLEDGNFPRQGIASKAGLHGAFAFPIVLGGEIVGVLDFFSRELRQPDKDLVEMMTAIGSQIGQFIERQRVQDSLRGANEQLELLVRASPLAITSLDCHGRVLTWNTAAERIFGWTAAEVLGQPLPIVPSDQREAFQKRFASELQGAWHSALEVSRIRKDGSRVDVSLWTTPLRDAKNTIMAVLCFLADITDRKLLEEQFRQAQKMEAVGKLAGGVAHDFNNLLTVINGYGEILLGNLRQGDPLRGPMEEIKKAGDRAARLTRQLLAFSRKQVLVPVLLDFNTLLIEMEKMLGRLIGEDVSMTVCPAPDLWRVKVDPGQMEQVIMNIVINARDAMPKGGKLTLETANVVLDGAYVGANTEAHPGEHVRLTISDTGAGMDNATKVRVFEPFFTTKGPEKGTGLGLATVYGIVKQSGGHISVYSELGIGTTFKIYLPRVEDAVQTSKSQVGFKSAARGSETVLLVEDEEGVRTLARLVLQGKGYKVLEARHGGEALLICEQNKDPVHILLTDVVMPSISGRELAARLKQLRPALKVLYMSGYTDDAVVRHGILEAEMPFLQKPFSPDVLAEMVRHVLDAP